jgi:hypothetical protein
MAKSYDLGKYDSWSFDDHFCLRPPFVLTAAIVYLCRSFLLVTLILAASTRGRDTGMEALLPGGDHPMSIGLTAIPAMLVLYARIRRSPKAGRLARWAWKQGRWLLASSAILEIVSGVLLLSSSDGAAHDSIRIAFLFLDFYILLYVLLSKHVRDVFSDFPQA